MSRSFKAAATAILVLSTVVRSAVLTGMVVDSRSSEPVSGATVALLLNGEAIGSMSSLGDGSYRFDNVAAGTYQLTAVALGYQPALAAVIVRPNNATVTQNISLTPTATQGAGTIMGTVTDSASTEPLEGVTVVLAIRSGWGGGSVIEPIDTITTNAEGTYSFTSVSVGPRYLVSATLDGYFPGSKGNIRAVDQDTVTIDFALAPVGDRVGSIAGTVTDASGGEPLVGAEVVLGRRLSLIGDLVALDTVWTAGDGSFLVADVVAQKGYVLAVTATGYEPAVLGPYEVVIGDTVTVDVQLFDASLPTSVISGVVLDDADSTVIAAATVILTTGERDLSGSMVWTPVDTVKSSSDGVFEFVGLAASAVGKPYGLQVLAEGYAVRTVGGIQVAEGDTTHVSVALSALTYGNMHVYVAAEVDATPLVGAKVSVALERAEGQVYSGSTGANGWVDFADLLAGDYTITVSLSGYVTEMQSRRVTANEEDSATVLLAEAGGADSRTIVGTVRDAEGRVVTGARIVLTAGTSTSIFSLVDSSDEQGAYEIPGIPLQYASVTVVVDAAGYREFSTTVNLTQDTILLDIQLESIPISAVRSFAGGKGALAVLAPVGTGRMEFRNVDSGFRVTIYSLNGRRVFSSVLPAGDSVLRIPESISAQRGVLTVEQRGRTVWRGTISH